MKRLLLISILSCCLFVGCEEKTADAGEVVNQPTPVAGCCPQVAEPVCCVPVCQPCNSSCSSVVRHRVVHRERLVVRHHGCWYPGMFLHHFKAKLFCH